MVVPEYGDGWKCKLTIPSLLAGDRLSITSLTVADPSGRAAHRPHDAGRLSPDGGGHELQAAHPKDDGVLPRRPAELRRCGDAEPPRVRPGLLREAGRRGGRLQAHRPPVQDPGLRARRAPGSARSRSGSRPPTTDTFSLAQSQEEFYFALPYVEMDLCLWAYNHGTPAGEVAAVLGLTADQVERVYRDIEAKRRVSRYLHQAAAARFGGDGGRSQCAASPESWRFETGRRRRHLDGLAGHGRGHAPPRPRRVRPLPGSTAPAWSTPASPSSTSPPASSRSPTRTARSGWSSTARSSTTWSCGRSSLALGHRFRTRSDTEVIVHAWEAWGERAFERFNGQFAIALWDARRGGAGAGPRQARGPPPVLLRARRRSLVRRAR